MCALRCILNNIIHTSYLTRSHSTNHRPLLLRSKPSRASVSRRSILDSIAPGVASSHVLGSRSNPRCARRGARESAACAPARPIAGRRDRVLCHALHGYAIAKVERIRGSISSPCYDWPRGTGAKRGCRRLETPGESPALTLPSEDSIGPYLLRLPGKGRAAPAAHTQQLAPIGKRDS